MGQFGRKRVEDELAWVHQAPAYVGVYDRLLGISRTAPASSIAT
jgi:asparagine synthase (glutamine-hydrolysing)